MKKFVQGVGIAVMVALWAYIFVGLYMGEGWVASQRDALINFCR